MFGTIRKHQSWLWFLIIGVVIIGMITWTNQLGKSGQQASSSGIRVNGKPVSESDFNSAKNEAELMFLLQTGEWPDSPRARGQFDVERQTYQRIFLIRKLAEYNIHSDPDSVAEFANLVLRKFGQGQNIPLSAFVDQVLKPRGIPEEDFHSFLEHYLSIQQLAAVVGAGGKLVTPAEIQSLYIENYQEFAVDAVFFSASNYLEQVKEPTPAELGQFYTNYQANYRDPDQLQVSYVFFNATNFVPEAEKEIGATNLDRDIRDALTSIGTNSFRYGKTPEEVRSKVRELLLLQTAMNTASNKAFAFERTLDAKDPVTPDNLAIVAKQNGLEPKVTKPFEKEYGPDELHLGQNFPMASLFNLTPDDPFVPRPVHGVDGFYVIAYDKSIPSRIPPLDEIRSRVVSDYKMAEAMRTAQISGHMFSQTASNELAHGKTFAAVASEAKVTPISVAPFSLSSERMPQIEDLVDVNTFKEVAHDTPAGGLSGFIPDREGGFVIHLREKLPIDQTQMKERLPQFSNIVRQRRESEAFELWFQKEASEGLRDVPVFQQGRQGRG